MSYIHQLAVKLIESGEYDPKDYQHARLAAAGKLARECVQAAADSTSGAIWNTVVQYDRTTRKAIADVLTSYNLLNDYSCPKAFNEGYEAFIGA